MTVGVAEFSSRFISLQAQAELALGLQSLAPPEIAPTMTGILWTRDPLETTATVQFRRLTSFYRIPMASPFQRELIRGLQRLRTTIARKNAHFEKGRSGSRARLAAAQYVFPGVPRWLQDLLIHLYLERKTSPDDFGFVLRTARLMQGVSNVDIGRNGFNEHLMKYVEKGSLLKRGSFREACVLYGVPYRPLAFSYLRKHFGSLPWKRSSFFTQPLFIDAAERPKLQAYARRPGTLGEMLFFARARKDLTQEELVRAVQAEIGRLVTSGRLRRIPPKTSFNKQDLEHVEANRHYLPLAKCLALAMVLDIPWDDFLRALLWSYAPALLKKYPRLAAEPVFVNHGESGDERKIAAYGKRPGSTGEKIFWERKRRLWTLEDLAEESGLRSDLIYRYELNRRKPGPDQVLRLESALGKLGVG